MGFLLGLQLFLFQSFYGKIPSDVSMISSFAVDAVLRIISELIQGLFPLRINQRLQKRSQDLHFI